jgi:starch synthase
MPRYGNINERRHQLHEVIRLSGMNLSEWLGYAFDY